MKKNPHKSFSSLNAKRARAEAAVLAKAGKHYAKAAQLEKQKKPLQARAEAAKGRALIQRARKAGAYTDGPVGRLPNGLISRFREAKQQRAAEKKLADIQSQIRVQQKLEHAYDTDPMYDDMPHLRRRGRASARHKLRALKTQERKLMRNGITEAAAGLQALEYLGGKVRGKKNPFDPESKHGITRREIDTARRRVLSAAAGESYNKAYRYYRTLLEDAGYTETEAGKLADHVAQIREERKKRNPGDIHIDAGHVTIVGKTKRIRTQNPRLVKGSKIVKARESDGAIFPVYNGELLSWSIGLYITPNEERAGFPRAKRVIQAMRKYRPEQLARERHEMLKGSFDRLFGHNAKKVLKLIDRKHNPNMTTLSQTFQGKANGSIDEYYASDAAPKNLARAGKLVFLKVAGRSLRLPGAMVAIAPNNKLWITGKQALFSTKARPGEGLDVGEVSHICYETAKAHIENGETVEYVHEFGEEGGKRPHLIIDHEGMPILRGGDYTIRAEGIVN